MKERTQDTLLFIVLGLVLLFELACVVTVIWAALYVPPGVPTDEEWDAKMQLLDREIYKLGEKIDEIDVPERAVRKDWQAEEDE